MKALGLLFVVSVAVIMAVCVVARQLTLRELRSSNQALRAQIEATPSIPPSPASAQAQPDEEEHLELLRLRGQIQSLRREANAMSNRVARLVAPK